MKNLPNHIRNYELVERKCEDLFEFLLISDQQLKTQTTGLLLLDIVPCIESLAKDLHQELSPQFPDLPQFKDGEPFDYAALAFLDRALGLSKKQVKITSKLIPSLSGGCYKLNFGALSHKAIAHKIAVLCCLRKVHFKPLVNL